MVHRLLRVLVIMVILEEEATVEKVVVLMEVIKGVEEAVTMEGKVEVAAVVHMVMVMA